MDLFNVLNDFEFHIDKGIMDDVTPVSDLVFRPKTKDTFTSTKTFTDTSLSDTYVIKMPEFEKAATVATAKTKEDNRSFYDDEMLDYLLKDITEKKAEEAEELLKKKIESDKRRAIKYFINSIRKVQFTDPWTIIFWKNGEVTRIKCQDGDEYSKETGLALGIIKHMFGDTNYFNTIFTKLVSEEDN